MRAGMTYRYIDIHLSYEFNLLYTIILSCSNLSDSEGPNRKKKRRSQSNNKRQRSLSPLSKRMAMLGDGDTARTHNSQFNHPYGYQPPPPPEEPVAPVRTQADIDYELKVSTK